MSAISEWPNAVAGQHAEAIPDILTIIADRPVPAVGHHAARFRHDDVGRAGVPLLRAGVRMNVELGLPTGDQPDFEPDAADAAFPLKAHVA